MESIPQIQWSQLPGHKPLAMYLMVSGCIIQTASHVFVSSDSQLEQVGNLVSIHGLAKLGDALSQAVLREVGLRPLACTLSTMVECACGLQTPSVRQVCWNGRRLTFDELLRQVLPSKLTSITHVRKLQVS